MNMMKIKLSKYPHRYNDDWKSKKEDGIGEFFSGIDGIFVWDGNI